MCYIFVEKRGVFIKKLINWKLYNNENLVIDDSNKYCDYIDDEIIYIENGYFNKVSLITKKFIRENNEYKIELDFNNNEMVYLLKEKGVRFSTEFKGSININGDEIKVKYNIDEDDLLIIIQIL